MKLAVLVFLGFLSLVVARPDSVLNFDLDDIHHDQDIDDDQHVTGSYSWTSPEGIQYFVTYVADDDGFRVVESNAIPVSSDGIRVDGNQGSFASFEDLDDK